MEKTGPEVVGREAEMARLDELLDGTATATLITGEAGIGKSELWRAGIDRRRRRGWRVLDAAPAEVEAQFSFAALGDLLAGSLDEVLPALPRPQRAALEVALFLREPGGEIPDHHAVAVGFLAAVRLLAADAPVLVAVDDVQWLDAPSASLLSFALRRLPGEPVRALLTCRSGHAMPLAMRAEQIELGPLSLGAIHRLVGTRLGRPLPRPLLRRLHERAHGNPLHALELARAVQEDGSVVAPRDLTELVSRRLLGLPASARDTLLHVAASPRPTLEVARIARPDAADRDVREAVQAGLLLVEGRRLRFAHPLFAAACYQAATPEERRAAHARLATVAADPEERARHLALAAAGPDAAVAEALDEGAQAARAHGAPDAAAGLTELARRLTPDSDGAARRRRTLALARHLLEAGEPADARRVLEELIAAEPPGPERAPALVALSEAAYEAEGAIAAGEAAALALEEAGEDRLLAAEAHLAFAERAEPPVEVRLDHIGRALQILEHHPRADAALLARALRERTLADYHRGLGLAREPLERAAALEDGLSHPPAVAWRARTIFGECLKYVDGFAEADALLATAERQADAEGDIGSLPEILGHRAELALWLGSFGEAAGMAGRAVGLARESARGGRVATASMFAAVVAAHRGLEGEAREAAGAALAAARENEDRWSEALTHAALGFLELSVGAAADAAAALGRTHEYASRVVVTEPRQWRYLPDYVEALAATGQLDLAADRLARLEQWAAGAGTDWPAALAARARGLLAGARGEREQALAALEAAAARHERLPLPFDRARTLLALGAAQRRARRKREARASLEEAVAVFEALGAPLWAASAREELGRISGRSGARGELTTSERRVAELVADGRKNKEIAAALVVTPRTVEAHLTRIYAKLGVRSRAELATRIAART